MKVVFVVMHGEWQDSGSYSGDPEFTIIDSIFSNRQKAVEKIMAIIDHEAGKKSFCEKLLADNVLETSWKIHDSFLHNDNTLVLSIEHPEFRFEVTLDRGYAYDRYWIEMWEMDK